MVWGFWKGAETPQLLLVFLVPLTRFAVGQATCDCDHLPNRSDPGRHACGEDGLTYATECLAFCQGVGVAGDPSLCKLLSFQLIQQGTGGWVGKSVVQRFRSDGFRFLGSAVPRGDAVGEGGEFSVWGSASEAGSVGVRESVDLLWTMEGEVYGRPVSQTQQEGSPLGWLGTATKGFMPSNSNRKLRASRKLKLSAVAYMQVYGDNGKDDRTLVEDTTADPVRSVGYVEPMGCTGTLIGPRHVLTSAHCVYDRSRRRFERGVRFTPALSRDARPFGSTSADHVLVKSCFLNMGYRECDFAVIVLREPLGYVAGWFGVGLDCPAHAVTLETAGYPEDKANGTMWREVCGECETTCDSDPGLIKHNCDMSDGMSGAPLWDGAKNIRAIHRGFIVGRNVAVYITPFVFNNIVRWTSGGYISDEVNAG